MAQHRPAAGGEPDKLRSWLCGIARRLVAQTRKRQGRDLIQGAESLEAADDLPGAEPLPSEQAIENEEAAVLWRSLEQIPVSYREPLVLFYLEDQSIQSVAEALGLSEDAVKQRLARGRKLLHEEMLVFVETALARTRPGKAFTLGVVAALPALATSTSAATVMSASAKSAAAMQAGLTLNWLGALLGPLVGFGAGCWVRIRNTKSPRERQFVVRVVRIEAVCFVAFLLAMFGWLGFGRGVAVAHPVLFGSGIGLLVLVYVAALWRLTVWSNRRQRQVQVEDGTCVPSGRMESGSHGSALTPSKRSIYGSLGGAIIGALAWLICAAIHEQDWLVAALVALTGAVIFRVSSRAWLSRPMCRQGILLRTLMTLCVVTLLVLNASWGRWPGIGGANPGRENGMIIGMNVGLLLLYAVLGLFLHRKGRAHSAASGDPLSGATRLALLAFCSMSFTGCRRQGMERPAMETSSLSNGIQAVAVHLPGSTNVSIFSFLPLGLTSDGPNQAQWSHLVEHLLAGLAGRPTLFALFGLFAWFGFFLSQRTDNASKARLALSRVYFISVLVAVVVAVFSLDQAFQKRSHGVVEEWFSRLGPREIDLGYPQFTAMRTLIELAKDNDASREKIVRLASATAHDDAGAPLYPDGDYIIEVTAFDSLGNSTIRAMTVTVDNAGKYPITIRPPGTSEVVVWGLSGTGQAEVRDDGGKTLLPGVQRLCHCWRLDGAARRPRL